MSDKADKNGKNTGSDDKIEKPESSVAADLEKAKKDYLYLLAEFDNYRKNAIKERSEMIKFGSEKLVREFLGVLDNFERALDAGADGNNLREGVQMIMTDLRQLLNRFGVEEVRSEGQKFDPASHEALSSEPRSDMEPGHVARVFKKAYKMHDKLLRPAQVVVSAAAKDNQEEK